MTISTADARALQATVAKMVWYCNGPFWYTQSDPRCDPDETGHADCSGGICSAVRTAGGRSIGCENSWQMSAECYHAGGLIRVDQALATVGAWLVKGYQLGMSGGSNHYGHIAKSLGNGMVAEFANSRAGARIGPGAQEVRQWDAAYLPLPWFPTMTVAWQDHPDAPAPIPEHRILEESMPILISKNDKGECVTAKVLNGTVFVTGTSSNPFKEGKQGKMTQWDPKNNVWALDLQPFVPPHTIIDGFPPRDEHQKGPEPGSWIVTTIEDAGSAGRVVREKVLHKR